MTRYYSLGITHLWSTFWLSTTITLENRKYDQKATAISKSKNTVRPTGAVVTLQKFSFGFRVFKRKLNYHFANSCIHRLCCSPSPWEVREPSGKFGITVIPSENGSPPTSHGRSILDGNLFNAGLRANVALTPHPMSCLVFVQIPKVWKSPRCQMKALMKTLECGEGSRKADDGPHKTDFPPELAVHFCFCLMFSALFIELSIKVAFWTLGALRTETLERDGEFHIPSPELTSCFLRLSTRRWNFSHLVPNQFSQRLDLVDHSWLDISPK